MLTHAFVLQSALDIFSANLFQPGPDDNMDLLLPLKTNGVRKIAHTCMSCSVEIYPFGPIKCCASPLYMPQGCRGPAGRLCRDSMPCIW